MSVTQLDREPGDLSRRIAHALRSPLGVVQGALQDAGDAELQAKLWTLGARAARQLDRLASRLSVISQLEAGNPMALEQCDFVVLGDAAIEAVAQTRVRRGIDVRRDFPRVQCMVDADGPLLQHAAAELVDNAVRFATRVAEISLRSDATHVILRTYNDGAPLDPDEFAAALDGSVPLRDRSGLGAGLWSTAVIANRHAGNLHRLEPPASGGVVLELRIPHQSTVA